MIRAAGVLFLTPDGLGLFMQRGAGGDHSGEWAFVGGHIEEGETAEDAAVREAREEAGDVPDGERSLLCRSISPPGTEAQVDFTTYLQKVDAPFPVTINHESDGFAWAKLSAPPRPLHPGCELAIARLTMDELGVARAMMEGRLPSPQRYQNVTLWNMRITGTGVSYRPSLDEFVYRPPEHYLNPDFLARIGGLSAIVEHPDKAVMDSDEFAARVVGSVMLPYIKAEAEEVWAVVRVYDDETNEALAEEDEVSTSPTVLLRQGESTKMKLEDGKTLLLEGAPALVDHIAILINGRGVWDKQGPAAGIDRSGVEAHADSADIASDNLRKLLKAGRAIALLSARMSNLAASR